MSWSSESEEKNSMDKTPHPGFVRSARGPIDLLRNLESLADHAFRCTGPRNVLNKLDDAERMMLFILLYSYGEALKKRRSFDNELERVAKVVADAALLGAKLESEIFQGPYAKKLFPWTARFRDLPNRLIEFSQGLTME